MITASAPSFCFPTRVTTSGSGFAWSNIPPPLDPSTVRLNRVGAASVAGAGRPTAAATTMAPAAAISERTRYLMGGFYRIFGRDRLDEPSDGCAGEGAG